MKIIKFEFLNYKALRGKHSFEPNGHSFYLVGANGVAKTSIGRSLVEALTKNLPQQPITHGEKEGYIEITLDGGQKLYVKFTEGKKPLIEMITADGFNVGAPKDVFDRLAGKGMTFNINEFLSMQPKPRRAMIENMIGVDLSGLNTREKEAEEKRRLLKQQLKEQQARVEPFDNDLLTKKKTDTAAVSKELEAALKTNGEIETIKGKVSDLETKNTEIEEEIRLLQVKLQNNKDQITAHNDWLKKAKAVPEKKMEDMRTKIANADKDNKAIDDAINMKKEYDLAKQLQERVDAAEQQVKDIRTEKDKLLRENPLPADGMTFSEDGDDILLDGFPFDDNQIATSKKMIAAAQIAEKMLGDIKYLHFDASILDKHNAEKVLEWAESKGLQLCLERAEWDGGELKFEIADAN